MLVREVDQKLSQRIGSNGSNIQPMSDSILLNCIQHLVDMHEILRLNKEDLRGFPNICKSIPFKEMYTIPQNDNGLLDTYQQLRKRIFDLGFWTCYATREFLTCLYISGCFERVYICKCGGWVVRKERQFFIAILC